MDFSVDLHEYAIPVLEWVQKNYNINEVYSNEEILEYVQGEYWPEDVFTDRQLVQWAEENGYALEE
jgi:hypothetical protein